LRNLEKTQINPLSKVGNKFVDYFTFLERLNTKSKQGLNFFEVLATKNKISKKEYIQNFIKVIKKDSPEMPILKLWYTIFRLYYSSITIFRPIVAVSLYLQFKPTSVLDFTMGWGGRLVGACALDIPHYIGIDMNQKLKKPYEDMVETIKPYTNTDITLFFKDALLVDYSKLNYDMVLTSPPYYNLEIYNGSQIKTKEIWNNEFYEPIFERTFKYLKKGGHYCLNVPKEIYENVCLKVLGTADLFIPMPKSKRTQNEKYSEFIYVWKKSDKDEIEGEGITPIGRIGGKSKIAKQIIDKFPTGYNTFVEPFFGAGNIFFRIPDEKKAKKNVINDLDKDIYVIMKELKKRGKDLDKTIDRSPIKTREDFYKSKIKQDPESLIRKYKFSFFSTGKTFNNSKINTFIKTDFSQFEDKLKGVVILNQSFEKVIKKYDSPQTFFYLDPPYEKNKNVNVKDYVHYIDPINVYDALKNIKGKFLLSYNDSPNIRELFKNYKIETIKTSYEHTQNTEKRTINELVITNY
jgi:DNA adenine methylase